MPGLILMLTLAACAGSGGARAPDARTAAEQADPRAAMRRLGYDNDSVYFEFQVKPSVRARPGNPVPRYPGELRAAGTQGEVLTQFVVDTAGRIVPGSFKVLRSNHAMFTHAARVGVEGMRFMPAQIGGRRVKQLVQQPFHLRLGR